MTQVVGAFRNRLHYQRIGQVIQNEESESLIFPRSVEESAMYDIHFVVDNYRLAMYKLIDIQIDSTYVFNIWPQVQ